MTLAPTSANASDIVAPQSQLLDSSDAPLQVGSTAPDFRYKLSDGVEKQLSDFQGKRVILNFWATYCEPCREEMADLGQVQSRYNDVVVLAVNREEKLFRVTDFAQEVQPKIALIANPSGDISRRYQLRGVPVNFFINSDGTISAIHIGVVSSELISTYLQRTR